VAVAVAHVRVRLHLSEDIFVRMRAARKSAFCAASYIFV
jgi:hypothetical protein